MRWMSLGLFVLAVGAAWLTVLAIYAWTERR
jgi:hypothetical protein